MSALLDRVTTLESWSSTSALEIDDDAIARITERVKAGAGSERLIEVLDRLDQVKARVVAGADGNSLVEIDARLADLERRLTGDEGEEDSGGLAELRARVDKLGETSDGGGVP